jgi:hypothetical protein
MTLDAAKSALSRYKKNKQTPGNFLRAVLENNLQKAVNLADPESKENLVAIVEFIYNTLPSNLYGNPTAVETHLNPTQILQA